MSSHPLSPKSYAKRREELVERAALAALPGLAMRGLHASEAAEISVQIGEHLARELLKSERGHEARAPTWATWITAEGVEIPIRELADDHLRNVLRHLLEKGQAGNSIWSYLSAESAYRAREKIEIVPCSDCGAALRKPSIDLPGPFFCPPCWEKRTPAPACKCGRGGPDCWCGGRS